MQVQPHPDEAPHPLLPWPECCAPEGGTWIDVAGRDALRGDGAEATTRWFERLFGDPPVDPA